MLLWMFHFFKSCLLFFNPTCSLLLSSKRFRGIRLTTTRHSNSFSPWTVRLLNGSGSPCCQLLCILYTAFPILGSLHGCLVFARFSFSHCICNLWFYTLSCLNIISICFYEIHISTFFICVH